MQLIDVLENGADNRNVVEEFWPAASPNSFEDFFGRYKETRMREIRDTLHRMLLIMTAQGMYNSMRVHAQDNAVGTCADGFSAWAWNGEIGVCPATIDNEAGWPADALAGLLLHEVAHLAGVGHSTASFCTGAGMNECRSEDQVRQLATTDPDKSVKNADSYRFLLARQGNSALCHPYFETALSGWVIGGSYPSQEWRTFILCTPQSPISETDWICKEKITCGPNRGFIGSRSFALCG